MRVKASVTDLEGGGQSVSLSSVEGSKISGSASLSNGAESGVTFEQGAEYDVTFAKAEPAVVQDAAREEG